MKFRRPLPSVTGMLLWKNRKIIGVVHKDKEDGEFKVTWRLNDQLVNEAMEHVFGDK